MVVPFLPPDTYFSSLTSSLTIALFPLTRNFWALTICMENLVFKWKVHSGGMFSEKVIYLPCLHRIHENFCTICSELARLFPRKRQCPGWRIQGATRDESLPFQPVCYFTAVLLASPLIADFATQLWHSRWARFKFWSSVLAFYFCVNDSACLWV